MDGQVRWNGVAQGQSLGAVRHKPGRRAIRIPLARRGEDGLWHPTWPAQAGVLSDFVAALGARLVDARVHLDRIGHCLA
jgi:hypothetical protein